MNINDLLKIEEDEKILDYRFKNELPMWLFIRPWVFNELLKQEFSLEEPHIKVNPMKLNLSAKINYIYYTLTKFPYFQKEKKILILGAGIDNVFEKNTYTNRLYDNFVLEFQKETILMESSNKFYYPQPRRIQCYYSDLIFVITKLLRHIKIFNKKNPDIDSFVDFLLNGNNKKFKKLIEDIRIRLINIEKSLSIRAFLFKKLINKLNPKLIIIEDAHYGGFTDLIHICKRKGILTAEYQHGYIGKSHSAYNFHPNLHNKINNFLPDYLLTWGKFWSEQINTPVNKIEIGFPYLEEKIKNKNISKNNNNKKKLLLISGGYLPEKYIEIGINIKSHFGDRFDFYFRPHPSERPNAYKRYSKLIEMDWKLDMDNLYNVLLDVNIVVSLELSTVLFEALMFTPFVYYVRTEKTGFIMEKDNDLPFLVVDNLNDLIFSIETGKKNIENTKDIFVYESIKNYKVFLNNIGIV